MAFIQRCAFAAALLAGMCVAAMAQTVAPLTTTLPFDGIVYGFLLTDGTILYQGGGLIDWYRFTPDRNGSYVHGTFRPVASLPPDYIPYATSGGVLPDGRVLLIGGEYLMIGTTLHFELTNKMAIYDPRADTWTEIKPPAGWGFIGDSPWTILSDGQLLLGQKLTRRAAVLDPKTLAWTEVATTGKDDFYAEEGWTLLPGGSVLTVDVKDHPLTERFLPNQNPARSQWVPAGPTPANLQASDANSSRMIPFDDGKRIYDPPGEVGPAILRPNGTVFATGAVCGIAGTGPNGCIVLSKVGHTAIYHPGITGSSADAWTAGPDFPDGEGAGDSYANLLPNGNVLVEVNPAGTVNDARTRLERILSGVIHPAAAEAAAPRVTTPTWKFYEFDGTSLIPVPQADSMGGQASTLLLPTGQVMLNGQAVYTPAGTYRPDWAPLIGRAPRSLTPGTSYEISGRQFNGLSQANAYGDEFQVATNYPLVRITNYATGHVTYARTHDPSSMGVATGMMIVTTHFDVPKTIERGSSLLQVVANGIPSVPIFVRVQ
jgi:hypothetical protein